MNPLSSIQSFVSSMPKVPGQEGNLGPKANGLPGTNGFPLPGLAPGQKAGATQAMPGTPQASFAQAMQGVGNVQNAVTDGLQGLMKDFAPTGVEGLGQPLGRPDFGGMGGAQAGSPNFREMLGGLIEAVDAKQDASTVAARRLLTGESDNLHQTMIAMRESGLAFSLMVEVRNKLVESFQEVMRMQI